MTGVHLRLDEADKTPEQLAQRERTYQAAKVLRAAGFACDVREFYTGKCAGADAAGIFLKGVP